VQYFLGWQAISKEAQRCAAGNFLLYVLSLGKSGGESMSAIVNFAIKYLLPIFRAILPQRVQDLLINFLAEMAWVQRLIVNGLVKKEKYPRPHPYTLWTGFIAGRPPQGDKASTAVKQSPDDPATEQPKTAVFSPSGYVSWTGLVNRRYTGRHLPPADASYVEFLKRNPTKEVFHKLLRRPDGQFTPSNDTSALFCFFAQWFTDSFLRTNPVDRRQNTSNHEIDYCQIYGLDGWTSNALREREGGRMLLEEKLLPRIYDEHNHIRDRFSKLGYIRAKRGNQTGQEPGAAWLEGLGKSLGHPFEESRQQHLYAAGLERGNSTILYTALSTLCVREHNDVAAALIALHSDWDDDRLFETARLIMIRNVLQIVVEDYINHIVGVNLFRLKRQFAQREPWYRTNRISLEFNLLYRWHSLVPDQLTIDNQVYDHAGYRFNNAVLEQHGVERCINAASTQPAGRVQLYNTPWFLEPAEIATLDMSRTFAMQPFVKYCEWFDMHPPSSMMELVGGDAKAAHDLTEIYGKVENVELPVGLIAQARGKGQSDAVLPPLITTMVAVDAFTHILTNPVLSDEVYEAAFPEDLATLTNGRGGIAGLMARNAVGGTTVSPSFNIRKPLPSD
jgi:prostaglandin-endoperoxide synthase 2